MIFLMLLLAFPAGAVAQELPGYLFKADLHARARAELPGEKAMVLERLVEEVPGEPGALYTLLDSHAVFNLPMAPVISCLADHDGEADIYPRIVMSRDLTPDRGFGEPHIQEVRTDFTFIGIGDSFHYRIEKVPLLLEDGSFLIAWRLESSLDGKFRELYGSWYAAPLEPGPDGTPRTYIRNFVSTIFTRPVPGTAVTMKLFGTSDMRGFYDALREAAEKRRDRAR